MPREKALLLGRFQPPSIAHLEMVQSILVGWKHVTLAVVYDSRRPSCINPRWNTYLGAEDALAYATKKNPFTREEVVRMWEACLLEKGLQADVNVTTTQRPQFYAFNDRFPSETIDWIAMALRSGSSDAARERRRTYEELFGRTLWEVAPRFELHNTDIKKLVRDGNDWSAYIPRGAYEVFFEIKEPQRVVLG